MRKLASDPLGFFDSLVMPSGHGSRRKFGEIMAPFQRKRFADIAVPLMAVSVRAEVPMPCHWWEGSKGCSKDSDLAACLLWLLRDSKRVLDIQVGAADRGQARELKKAAQSWMDANPELYDCLEVLESAIVSRVTGGRAEIIASDTVGSHGSRPHLLIINELTHIEKQKFAENLRDNSLKVDPFGVMVVATNAGFQDSWQYEWREEARKNKERWCFHHWSQPAPWITKQAIADAESRATTPGFHARYRRLWWGEWSTESDQQAITSSDIDRAIQLEGELPPEDRGMVYVAGCDIGVWHDATAVVVLGKSVGWVERIEHDLPPVTSTIAAMRDLEILDTPDAPVEYINHPGDGKIRVVALRVWKPTKGAAVPMNEVKAELAALSERYGFAHLGLDRSQAGDTLQYLHGKRLRAEIVDSTDTVLKSMAISVTDAFRLGEILIPDHPDLISDLKGLKLVEQGERFKLTSQRKNSVGTGTAHGDIGSALGIAMHLIQRTRVAGPPVINRPLVCWPEV